MLCRGAACCVPISARSIPTHRFLFHTTRGSPLQLLIAHYKNEKVSGFLRARGITRRVETVLAPRRPGFGVLWPAYRSHGRGNAGPVRERFSRRRRFPASHTAAKFGHRGRIQCARGSPVGHKTKRTEQDEMSTTNRTTHDDGPQLTNGKITRHVNGHAKESVANATSRPGSSTRNRAQAASDDAHGTPDAPAPAPPAAASATHDACADAACVSNENSTEEHVAKIPGAARAGSTTEEKTDKLPVPPGALPLPKDGAAFVSAVHEKADIVEVGRRLLNSGDEKIVKAAWDRLVDLKFGADQSSDTESEGIDMTGAPRPIRNTPPATNL
jgi:hypothetical protein